MFTKIVVAIDNSPGSQRALELAKKLAKENGAHLDLVHVEEFLVGRAVGGQHANLLEDEIVTEIKRQATQLRDDGFDIALEVVPTVHGGPAHVVADVASRNRPTSSSIRLARPWPARRRRSRISGSEARPDRAMPGARGATGQACNHLTSLRLERSRRCQGLMPMTHGSASDVATIHAVGLTKHYGATVALDSLNLSVRAGEIYGFLGPNGAGKTTTIRLMLGLQKPTAGRVELFGLDAWAQPVPAHRRLAYVAGEPQLWPSRTGEECLQLLANIHGQVDQGYRTKLIERFAFDPRKRVREYSKGNRQKIQLIAAFATRADLLVLDEPTGGLDPLMEAAFRETVSEARSAGQTVFLSSHILSEVEVLCDRVGILRAGRMIEEGTLAELRHLSQTIVEAGFAGKPPPLPPLDGVAIVASTTNSLKLAVNGPVGPVIDALAGHDVRSLQSREPSLEELFLAEYDRDPDDIALQN